MKFTVPPNNRITVPIIAGVFLTLGLLFFTLQQGYLFFHITVETVRHMHTMLSNNGVAIINLIGAIEGPKSEFIRASLRTYQSVFSQVFLYKVQADRTKQDAQNLVLVASKRKDTALPSSDNPDIQAMLDMRFTGSLDQNIPVLTDDFAPVEAYTWDLLN